MSIQVSIGLCIRFQHCSTDTNKNNLKAIGHSSYSLWHFKSNVDLLETKKKKPHQRWHHILTLSLIIFIFITYYYTFIILFWRNIRLFCLWRSRVLFICAGAIQYINLHGITECSIKRFYDWDMRMCINKYSGLPSDWMNENKRKPVFLIFTHTLKICVIWLFIHVYRVCVRARLRLGKPHFPVNTCMVTIHTLG